MSGQWDNSFPQSQVYSTVSAVYSTLYRDGFPIPDYVVPQQPTVSQKYLLEVRLGLSPVAHLHHVVALLDFREVAVASLTLRVHCGLGTPTLQGLTVDVSNMKTFHEIL